MAKNKNKSSKQESKRNTILLIIAIILFLLGLLLFLQAYGFNIMEKFGINPGQRANSIGQSPNMNGVDGVNGVPGVGGSNGSGGNGNGNGSNPNGSDINVNIQSDTGAGVDVGVKDGRIYVNPTVQPNAQGGTGAEASVNDDKIIDTNSLFGN